MPTTLPMAQRKLASSGGRCIYCGNTESQLTREHIIPESLSGTWIIVGACAECANTSNREYENHVLQCDMIRSARAILDLKRKRANSKQPLKMPPIFKFGTSAKVDLASGDIASAGETPYPNFFFLPVLEPAAWISKNSPQIEIDKRPFRIWLQTPSMSSEQGRGIISDPINHLDFYKSSDNLMLSMDVKTSNGSVSVRQKLVTQKFLRFLTKIAYCYVIARYGFEFVANSELRQLVRGERFDFYNFVGGVAAEGDRLTDTYLHHIAFRNRGEWLTVLVHLFSYYNAPPFEIIVRKRC